MNGDVGTTSIQKREKSIRIIWGADATSRNRTCGEKTQCIASVLRMGESTEGN